MMRHVSSDKYTIAWFKLADCVARGEREKALGVYRLLAHSLEDQAYSYQLEGDLLAFFEDDRATEKYRTAAQLYAQNNRLQEALALYEMIRTLGQNDEPVVYALLLTYVALGMQEKSKVLLYEWVEAYAHLPVHDDLEKRITHIACLFDVQHHVLLYTRLAIAFLGNKKVSQETMHWVLAKTAQVILERGSAEDITTFMGQLLAIGTPYYEHVCQLLKNQK